MCSERTKLVGSRRMATIRAVGEAGRCRRPRSASTDRTAKPPRHAGLGRAAANSARYSSSAGSAPARSAMDRRACAVSMRALTGGEEFRLLQRGHEDWGWRRNIPDSAVVPLFGLPTMKKSGTRPATARLDTALSPNHAHPARRRHVKRDRHNPTAPPGRAPGTRSTPRPRARIAGAAAPSAPRRATVARRRPRCA